MAKTLSFTDTSPQTVKIGDTTTSFTLICGNDNMATDLTNATSITVKLGNASGYLKSATVDPASLTDPTTGQVTVNFNADLMTGLPSGSYAIEVWVVDSTGTSIYPSDGSTGFTITNNIQSSNGATITTITFDDFVEAMNKAASTIAKGDKGDPGELRGSIGGRNYLLDTAASKTMVGDGTHAVTADQAYKFVDKEFIRGKQMMFSADFTKTEGTIGGRIGIIIGLTWQGIGTINISDVPVGATKRFSFAVNVQDKENRGDVYFQTPDSLLNGSVTISNVKLEKGSIATDWTPAPEDLLTQTDYAKIQAAIVALGGSLS